MESGKLDFEKVIAALGSSTRRRILVILGDNRLTLKEIFDRLSKAESLVKYRGSTFRALEKLVDAGLVNKFYDNMKGICYKLLVRKIEIDLTNGKVSIKEQ